MPSLSNGAVYAGFLEAGLGRMMPLVAENPAIPQNPQEINRDSCIKAATAYNTAYLTPLARSRTGITFADVKSRRSEAIRLDLHNHGQCIG